MSKTRLVILSISGLLLAVTLAVVAYLVSGDGSGLPVPTPKNVNFDEADGGNQISAGETITLQLEQIANAGISLVDVQEVLSDVGEAASYVGVLQPDGYRDVPVLTVGAGRVVEVSAKIGDRVRQGQILAKLSSSDFADAQTAYIGAKTELRNARANFERSDELRRLNDESVGNLENARRDYASAKAQADEADQRRRRAERLLSIGAISRQEFEAEARASRVASAGLEEASKRLSRAERLSSVNPESNARSEDALRRLRIAEGQHNAERQRLLVFGLSDSEIQAIGKQSASNPTYPLRSPIAGEIISRRLNSGEFIDKGSEVFRVTDLERLWVVAQVDPSQSARLSVGRLADISDQIDGQVIATGKVTYIAPVLDQATRTITVRVEVPNRDRKLRVGSYIRMSIKSAEGLKDRMPAIPRSAIQNVRGTNVVFIQGSAPTVFEIRPVRLGVERNGLVPIFEGLDFKARVVDTGAFLLRAEWMKRNP